MNKQKNKEDGGWFYTARDRDGYPTIGYANDDHDVFFETCESSAALIVACLLRVSDNLESLARSVDRLGDIIHDR